MLTNILMCFILAAAGYHSHINIMVGQLNGYLYQRNSQITAKMYTKPKVKHFNVLCNVNFVEKNYNRYNVKRAKPSNGEKHSVLYFKFLERKIHVT